MNNKLKGTAVKSLGSCRNGSRTRLREESKIEARRLEARIGWAAELEGLEPPQSSPWYLRMPTE